jgi:D-alanyl-D-alanine carboxypeptidase
MRPAIAALLSLLLALAPAPGAAADVVFPDTPPGRQLRDFLDAFNAEDPAAMDAFETRRSDAFRGQVDRAMFLQISAALRGAHGELTPHSWIERHEASATLLVRASGSGSWLSVRVDATDAERGPVRGVLVRPAPPPADGPAPEPEWDSLKDLLEIERQSVGAPAIAGAIVEGDRIAEVAAVGLRRVGEDRRVRPDDRFHLGSVTKAVNATLIGVLVDRGVLSWDTTIGDALGDLEMRDAYRGATLRQLLEHKAGLPPYLRFGPEEMGRLVALPGRPDQQRAAFVAEALRSEPVAEPGSAAVYSNAGPTVAAVIAERATGLAWETLVERAVLAPLEITEWGVGWPEPPDEPTGHAGGVPVTPESYPLGAFLTPSGNLNMSAPHLARFARHHLLGLTDDRDPERARIVRSLHEAEVALDPARVHAAGWIVSAPEGRPVTHWHNGTLGTYYALVAIVPAERVAVVVLTNTAGPAIEPMAWRVVERVVGRRAAAR